MHKSMVCKHRRHSHPKKTDGYFLMFIKLVISTLIVLFGQLFMVAYG